MKYTILVNRYQTAEIEVEASSFDEAREAALDKAYNTDWGGVGFYAYYQTADEDGVFSDI